LLVLTSTLGESQTNTVDILSVDAGGRPQTLGRVPQAFASTARLAVAEDAIYLTAVEGTKHNLYSFSLTDGGLRRLTSNTLPGVTFSGVARLEDGTLLLSRQVENYDVWVLTSNPLKKGD
jgi:hypothetical protein